MRNLAEGLWTLLGAAAAGAGRDTLASHINPGFVGVAVDDSAWFEDAGAMLLGIGTAFLGDRLGKPGLERFGDGLLVGQASYLGQDLTHTVRRALTKAPAKPTAPTTIAQVQQPMAPPVPPRPIARSFEAAGGWDAEFARE